MRQNLWQFDTWQKRKIPGVDLLENEEHPTILSRLSFAKGARIFFGPTLAVSRILSGHVAMGWVQAGPDRCYIWEAREPSQPDTSYVGFFHPVERRLHWGILKNDVLGSNLAETGAGVSEVHWSVYVGAVLLAYFDKGNPDVNEVWPLLQEEWRERGLIGVSGNGREALFLINDFLYQNRFFYVQDTAQIEPLPHQLSRRIQDVAEELAGKRVPFSWMPKLEAASEKRDEDEQGSVLTTGRYALISAGEQQPEMRRLVPCLENVKLPAFLPELARMIKYTSEGRRPLRNILFYGPPGSGKSTLSQALAQLLNLPYYYVNLSLNAEEEVLLGKYVPSESAGRFRFDEPPFVQAFRYGGLVELMELNFGRPGVLGAVHSALDTPYRLTLASGEVVERHPNCVVVATMNLGIIGTQRMNEALKSRFQRKIHVEPLPLEELVDVVSEASGLGDREMIRKMAEVAMKMQRRIEQEGLQGQVGTRELIDWAQDVCFTGDPLASAWQTILPAAAMEHRDIQEELAQVLVENVFGTR